MFRNWGTKKFLLFWCFGVFLESFSGELFHAFAAGRTDTHTHTRSNCFYCVRRQHSSFDGAINWLSAAEFMVQLPAVPDAVPADAVADTQ